MDGYGQAITTAVTAAALALGIVILMLVAIGLLRAVVDWPATTSAMREAFGTRAAGARRRFRGGEAEGAARPTDPPRIVTPEMRRRRRMRDSTAALMSTCLVAVLTVALAPVLGGTPFPAPRNGLPPAGPVAADDDVAGPAGLLDPATGLPLLPGESLGPTPAPTGEVGGVVGQPPGGGGAIDPDGPGPLQPGPAVPPGGGGGTPPGAPPGPGSTPPGSTPPPGTTPPPGSTPPPGTTSPPGTTPPPGPGATPTPNPTAPPTPPPTPRPTTAPTPPPTPPPTPQPTPTPTPAPDPPQIGSFQATDQLLLVEARFEGSCAGCTEWMIDFGDGQSTGWRSGGIQTTHDYPRSGDYTARLTVRGPGGTDSATQSVSATLPIL